MTSTHLIASVVVAVSCDKRVKRLLSSLTRQVVKAGDFEVLVVENGSSELSDVDGTGSGKVRYIHLGEANAAAARNAGLRAARGRYLLLTDSDCVASEGWIDKLIAPLVDTQIGVVGGAIHKHDPQTWVQRHAITIVDGQPKPNFLPALHLPYVAGANACFRTTDLLSVGGFDETLKSGNDVDVCYKLGLAGFQTRLVPDAVIYHEDRATLWKHFYRFYRYALYQVLLYAKYKHVSGKSFVFDAYPFDRAANALLATPRALTRLLHQDPALAMSVLLQFVEAAGVFCGEIAGAIRFKQPYI